MVKLPLARNVIRRSSPRKQKVTNDPPVTPRKAAGKKCTTDMGVGETLFAFLFGFFGLRPDLRLPPIGSHSLGSGVTGESEGMGWVSTASSGFLTGRVWGTKQFV